MIDFLAERAAGGRHPAQRRARRTTRMRAREPGLVVMISDLLDPAGFERGVRALLERRFDVHLVHLLDPEEMNPTLGGDLRLIDSETGERRATSRWTARRCVATAIGCARFLERVEAFCRTQEIGYHRVTTDTPVEAFVVAQLRGRVLG